MIAFAKKIGMTRLFLNGKAVPCTVLQVQDSVVTQIKTDVNDGYNAIQLASCEKKNSTKAKLGHVKKSGLEKDFRYMSEFRDVKIADDKSVFDVNDFATDDLLSIIGTTMGRGFTGAVKRWGFAGQPKSHGHDHVRAVGSIGSRWPQRVPKGKKMAGHSGARQMTLNGVKIIAVDADNKLIFVNGSLPGANSNVMKISKINK